MDKRIFSILIAVILIAGSVLLLRMCNRCESPTITFDPIKPRIGDVVTFSCENAEGDLKWEFGDGKTSSGVTATNKFAEAKNHTVKATVNDGECASEVQVVVIEERKMQTVQPSVSFPATIYTGEEITFSENTAEASSWKWAVKETKAEFNGGNDFKTKFEKAGVYTISVSVNGAYVNGDTSFTVNVVKPEPKKVIIPAGPTPEQLEALRLKRLEEQERREQARKDAALRRAEELRKKKEDEEQNKPHYMSDNDFKSTIMQMGNDLHTDQNASDEWQENIIGKQACNRQITFILTDQDNDKETIKSEEFKRQLLLGQTVITGIGGIVRGKDNCISIVNVTVQTKK